jgi:hypothetical protein
MCLQHNWLHKEVGHRPDAVRGADDADHGGPAVAEAMGGQADGQHVDGFVAGVGRAASEAGVRRVERKGFGEPWLAG